jgi:hypothetical protein
LITDIQIITIAIAIIIPTAAVIYSNGRIADVSKRVDDSKETLRAEMALGFEKISNQIRELKDALHIHEIEHHRK